VEYLFLCPDAGLAFHFFLDKKKKQKNQGLQQFPIKPAYRPAGSW
jgi:hypothetical protein